jgi:hypothetical protein
MKLFGRSTAGGPGEVRRVTGSPPGVGGPGTGGPGTTQSGPGVGTTPADGPTPVPTRLQRLAASVEKSRRNRSDRDVRKLMSVVGMVAVGAGFVVIVSGGDGAAHSPYLYQEIPYVISGGLLGLALVIAGGVLIRSAWSLRQVEEERRNAVAIVRAVDRLERTMRQIEDARVGDQRQEEVSPWK